MSRVKRKVTCKNSDEPLPRVVGALLGPVLLLSAGCGPVPHVAKHTAVRSKAPIASFADVRFTAVSMSPGRAVRAGRVAAATVDAQSFALTATGAEVGLDGARVYAGRAVQRAPREVPADLVMSDGVRVQRADGLTLSAPDARYDSAAEHVTTDKPATLSGPDVRGAAAAGASVELRSGALTFKGPVELVRFEPGATPPGEP